MAGRDLARRTAHAVLTGAFDGRGRLLVLTGEAGIGKTTLARDLADDAAARGATVRWGGCWEGGSLVPFSVWIDALRRPGDDPCAATADRLADGTPDPTSDAATAARARARVFAEVIDALVHVSSTVPQVVVLEDLHWADGPSIDLVRAVAPHLPSMATLVVATFRDDELHPSALGALGGALEWLTLDGLTEPDVGSLLAEVLGRSPSTDEVRSVHDRTGGNPLFVTQVGRLLAAGAPAAVPTGVREVLNRRLARVSPSCHQVLGVAAVLGVSFELLDLSVASRRPEPDVLAALEEAGRARLVQPVDDRPDRWSFAHDLVRAARYELLGVGERAELHRHVLDALARRSTPAGVLAHHAARARFAPGDARPAVLAVAAAQEALARLAWQEALTLCERGLEAAPGGDAGDRWRAEALLTSGHARLRLGDDEGAAAAFEEAAALGRRVEDSDVIARAALGSAPGLASFEVPLMQPRQIALLEQARELLGPESPLRPLVLARLSVALSFMGADDRRMQLADEAVRLARAGGDPSVIGAAIAARCDAIAGPSHVAERLEAATEVIALAQRAGDLGLELLGRRHRVVALLERRDLGAFDAEVAAFASTADRLGDPMYSWWVPLWHAMRAHAEGRMDDAEALAGRARATGESGGSDNARLLERVIRLSISVDRGDVVATDAAWHELLAAHPELVALPLQHITTAWLHAEADRHDGVRRSLAALADTEVTDIPRDQEWLATIAQLILGAAAIGDRPMLEQAYEALLPYVGLGCFEGAGAVDRGVVDRFLALAAGHLGRLAALEQHATDAMTAGEASGPLVAADTVADCARAFAAAGVPSRAAGLAADAVARYEALGLDRRADRLRTLLGPSRSASEPSTASLVHEGDTWAFSYAGTTVRVRNAKGVADLAVLLASPGREVDVRALEHAHGLPRLSAQPALDDAAVAAYRDRLRDLEVELDEADGHADIERAAKLAAERDALVDELTRSLGLGGRRRPIRDDPDERLRKAVSARVKAAIERLEHVHPDLGRHLRNSVRTGYRCSYEPERPVAWQVSLGRHD